MPGIFKSGLDPEILLQGEKVRWRFPTVGRECLGFYQMWIWTYGFWNDSRVWREVLND